MVYVSPFQVRVGTHEVKTRICARLLINAHRYVSRIVPYDTGTRYTFTYGTGGTGTSLERIHRLSVFHYMNQSCFCPSSLGLIPLQLLMMSENNMRTVPGFHPAEFNRSTSDFIFVSRFIQTPSSTSLSCTSLLQSRTERAQSGQTSSSLHQ
jgi:hypothetical protein